MNRDRGRSRFFIAGEIVVKQMGDKDLELVEPINRQTKCLSCRRAFGPISRRCRGRSVWLPPLRPLHQAAILHDYRWRNTATVAGSRADLTASVGARWANSECRSCVGECCGPRCGGCRARPLVDARVVRLDRCHLRDRDPDCREFCARDAVARAGRSGGGGYRNRRPSRDPYT